MTFIGNAAVFMSRMCTSNVHAQRCASPSSGCASTVASSALALIATRRCDAPPACKRVTAWRCRFHSLSASNIAELVGAAETDDRRFLCR